jgi:antitoxin VapB
MALNIKNPEADRLARELAGLTGESITDSVIAAMKDRIARERARRGYDALRHEVRRIRERYRRLPVLDDRAADDVIGYDDAGVPD